MPVQVIALVTINENEPAALAKYLEVTTPLLESVGARIVQRFTVNEAVVGKEPAKSVILVDYPTREAVDQVFKSETYQAIIATRDLAFKDYSVSIITN